ncbi:MAG: RNA methyltransferase [Lentisphaeria bacterium]|nr:RNA methyltransferase [Lentisphaeria bacterium]
MSFKTRLPMFPDPTKIERQLLTAAASRHGRRKHGVSTCEGLRCARELITRRPTWVRCVAVTDTFLNGPETDTFFNQARANHMRVVQLSDNDFKKIAQTATPQGVSVLFQPGEPSPAAPPPPFALVLDRVTEPGNMGTILRTAWAAGLNRIWLTDGCVDPFAPKTIRAGMGAQFAVTLSIGGDLPALKKDLRDIGFTTMWLSKPSGGISSRSPDFDLSGNALVIGNEANGVTDIPGAPVVTIPMPGEAESLNASQAAAMLLYEAVRRGILA